MRTIVIAVVLALAGSASAERMFVVQPTQLHHHPSHEGNILAELAPGDRVTVLSLDGRWIKVRYQGKTGFILRHAVEQVPPLDAPLRLPATGELCARVNERTKLRDDPRGGSWVVHVPEDSTVAVLARDGRWLQVRAGGRVGWIPSSKLDDPDRWPNLARCDDFKHF